MKARTGGSACLGILSVLTYSVLFGPADAKAAEYFCPSGDTGCLIAALESANVDFDEDIIRLEAGTYWLSETGLDVRTSLVLEGNGATLERAPDAPPFTVVSIPAEPANWGLPDLVEVELHGLTIRGGDSQSHGAGLFVNDYDTFVTVVGCTIEDNRGFGAEISGLGTQIIQSVIRNNLGGGIWGAVGLSIIDSVIEGNLAGNGGYQPWGNPGLEAWGRTYIKGSTIRGNVGGGIAAYGPVYIADSVIDSNESPYGAGIYQDPENFDTVEIFNSTISRNVASEGAGAGNFRRALMRNVTITENLGATVGGLMVGACAEDCAGLERVEIANSILHGNTGNDSDDCAANSEAVLHSGGHNVLGDVSDCGVVAEPSDLLVDPELGVFTDNGTPGNGHYMPTKESPAIDAADNSSCTPSDQIGNGRYDGDGDGVVVCDIGAIEYQGEGYEVAIDFKPGNARNVINPRNRGRFWLAILSGDDVDAPQVDPGSVALGAGEAAPDRYRIRDVNRDRAADLVLRFRTPAVGIACGDTNLELVGETYSGDSVHGTDMIRTVGCKANGNKRKKK